MINIYPIFLSILKITHFVTTFCLNKFPSHCLHNSNFTFRCELVHVCDCYSGSSCMPVYRCDIVLLSADNLHDRIFFPLYDRDSQRNTTLLQRIVANGYWLRSYPINLLDSGVVGSVLRCLVAITLVIYYATRCMMALF